MSDSSSLLLIAGCYERFLFGFKCSARAEVRSRACRDANTPHVSMHCKIGVLHLTGAQNRQDVQLPSAQGRTGVSCVRSMPACAA